MLIYILYIHIYIYFFLLQHFGIVGTMLKSSLTRSIPHFPGISLAFLVSTPFREAGLPQRAS